LEYASLVREVKRGKVRPVYFFYGEEPFFAQEFIRLLRECWLETAAAELQVHRFPAEVFVEDATTLEDVIQLAYTGSFFASRRLIVAHIDHLVTSRGREGAEKRKRREAEVTALLNYAEQPAPEVVLVLVAANTDRRLQAFQRLRRCAASVACEPLTPRELVTWLQQRAREQGYQLSEEAARLLAEAVEDNLTMAEHELAKLLTYADSTRQLDAALVRQLVPASLSTDIFQLVDAVAAGDVDTACRLLRRFALRNEPFARILYMLARQFRLIWQVKLLSARGLGPKEIASRQRLHPFVVRKALQQARHFTAAQLARALEILLAADIDLKTGRWEPRLGLELLAVKLARQAKTSELVQRSLGE